MNEVIKIDCYTKIILTIIAIALSIIVIKDLVPGTAYASENMVQDVRIISIAKNIDPLDVKVKNEPLDVHVTNKPLDVLANNPFYNKAD